MAKTINLNTQQQKESQLIIETYKGNATATYALYKYCADYFHEKYPALFHATTDVAKEILQNSFITFWNNIENRKIYVANGLVMDKKAQPLNGSIRTYFMGIAKFKYLEWVREHPYYADPDTEMGRKIRANGFDEQEYMEAMYGESDHVMLDILSDLLSNMSKRCYEILSKFYYEEKDLDRILTEIPSIESKKALKTKKNKCISTLRKVAKETYRRFLNEK